MRHFFILISILFTSLYPAYAGKKKKSEELESKLLAKITLNEHLDDFNSSLYDNKPSILLEEGEELGFDYYYALVFSNYPKIISAEVERQKAAAKRLETQGAFDPSINSDTFFRRFNSSTDIGDVQNAFTSDTSLDFLTRYGAKVGLGAKFANGDIKTPISPTGDTGEYFVKLQVPLLRNAIYNSKSVKEKSAKLLEVIADFLLYRTKLEVLQNATYYYWKWVSTKKILDVERNLLNLIADQVDFVQAQADLGNLPQIAVTEAQREAQKRKVKVGSALRYFQEASINIAGYLWSENGLPYPIPKAQHVPEAYQEPLALDAEDVAAAKLKALELRPEFKALNLSREISVLERKLAKNQMLPEINVYANSGIETGEDSIGPTVEAGLNLSLPLRVRTARGQMQQAELEIKKLNLEERQLIQNVFLEIEDIASQIDTSYQRYEAAKLDFELSQKLEQGEKDKFDLGDSTLFVVIRRQRATVEANIELIKAIADYHTAIQQFKLIQGDLS